ncbi:hypothetical protein ABBQ38_015461 [Trebouxia sp. C0009 RCD-2024]
MSAQAVTEAVARDRAATAAMLQAAAAQQSATQHRSVAGFDSRAAAHLSRQCHQQQLSVDQEPTLPRSRLGNTSSQQAHLSPEQGKPAGLPAGNRLSVHRYSNGRAQDIPSRAESVVDASTSGALSGIMRSPSTEELRDGFRRAVSAVLPGDEQKLSNTKADALMPCFIKTALPHVASWGNLSNHSSSSNSGLLHSGVNDTGSRGLPTFEPTSTPAGMNQIITEPG